MWCIKQMKILFYITSLIPLSFLIFLKLWDYKNPYNFIFDWKFYYYMLLIPCFSGILLFFIYYIRANIDKQPAKKFTDISYQDSNFFIPISLYFVPFITSDFNFLNDWLVTSFILFFIGIIIVKTNLQYLNPFIVILGLKLYKAKCDEKEVFVLSHNEISSEYQGSFNKITNNLYKLKRSSNDKQESKFL